MQLQNSCQLASNVTQEEVCKHSPIHFLSTGVSIQFFEMFFKQPSEALMHHHAYKPVAPSPAHTDEWQHTQVGMLVFTRQCRLAIHSKARTVVAIKVPGILVALR